MRKKRVRLALTPGQIGDLYNLAEDRAMEERELDQDSSTYRRFERLSSFLERQPKPSEQSQLSRFRFDAASMVIRLVKNFPQLACGEEVNAWPVPPAELLEWIQNEVFAMRQVYGDYGRARMIALLTRIASNDGIDEERAATDAIHRMRAHEARA